MVALWENSKKRSSYKILNSRSVLTDLVSHDRLAQLDDSILEVPHQHTGDLSTDRGILIALSGHTLYDTIVYVYIRE